jgi:hypothetical protein
MEYEHRQHRQRNFGHVASRYRHNDFDPSLYLPTSKAWAL